MGSNDEWVGLQSRPSEPLAPTQYHSFLDLGTPEGMSYTVDEANKPPMFRAVVPSARVSIKEFLLMFVLGVAGATVLSIFF